MSEGESEIVPEPINTPRDVDTLKQQIVGMYSFDVTIPADASDVEKERMATQEQRDRQDFEQYFSEVKLAQSQTNELSDLQQDLLASYAMIEKLVDATTGAKVEPMDIQTSFPKTGTYSWEHLGGSLKKTDWQSVVRHLINNPISSIRSRASLEEYRKKKQQPPEAPPEQ